MKVICFDLDDTLYKEIDYLKSAYQEICERIHSVTSIENRLACEDLVEAYYRGENVFEYVNRSCHIDLPIETYLNWYRLHEPQLKLSEAVESVLSFFQEKQWIIGLITDGRSITQRNKIKALSLSRFIDNSNILISEEFGSEKPNLKNYLYFQEKYPLSSYYYIGDNPKKDFITPNQLGWTKIGLIDDGRNIHKQNVSYPKENAPSYWIAEIQEVKQIIR